jgi:dihydrodipicolinate synthase/N-acetylneuraminate lyase
MISGVIPMAPTTFDEDENLDLASQARVTDFLISARAE